MRVFGDFPMKEENRIEASEQAQELMNSEVV